MSWVAVAIGGSAVATGVLGREASRDAARAAEAGSEAGIAETARQFDTVVGLQRPYNVTGTGALNKLAQLVGLPYARYQEPDTMGRGGSRFAAGGSKFGTDEIIKMLGRGMSVAQIQRLGYYGKELNPHRLKKLQRAGLSLNQIRALQQGSAEDSAAARADIVTPKGQDLSVFEESPDYQFRLREGQEAVDRTAAARSGALGGNVIRAQTEFASDLASTEFANFFGRLATIAGIGQGAAGQTSQAAQNTGANISNLLTQTGAARASGILGGANSITNAVDTGLTAFLLNRGGFFNRPAGAGA